jgi:uncharacterized protein YkwD
VPDATIYTTSAGSNGVRGGEAAKQVQSLLEEELSARGDIAEPDAALASTAAWALRTAYAREEITSSGVATAAQRSGFVGLMLGSASGSVAGDLSRTALHDLLNQVPKNTPINRYGIAGGRGQDAVVVIGVVEASLADFPRSVPPGGTLRLKGGISERFQHASVFATNPEGKIDELPMSGRDIDATLTFPSSGVYKLELLGYGATGPVVLVNVPIQVGVEEKHEAASKNAAAPIATPEEAEAALLSLLNAERKRQGLTSLASDAELRGIALAHSEDMTAHHFFGHVSPTTGTPEDRVRAAGLRVSKFGECVALDFTPDAAFRGLMDSPAHRAAMLDPSFTHVGIGVSFVFTNGQRRLNATLLFGRRPAPEDARMSSDDVLEALQTARKQQSLPALRVDPVLSAAATAGSRALEDGSAKDSAAVLAAVGREMQRQVNRTHMNRSACQYYAEILDRQQLTEIAVLKRADIVAIGIGTAPLQDANGPKLGLVLMADSGPGKAVNCN